MVQLVKIIFFILILTSNSFSNQLNDNEKILFNFIDINKDKNISFEEITNSLNMLFKIIDKNVDNKISPDEIIDLKIFIESLT